MGVSVIIKLYNTWLESWEGRTVKNVIIHIHAPLIFLQQSGGHKQNWNIENYEAKIISVKRWEWLLLLQINYLIHIAAEYLEVGKTWWLVADCIL